MRHVRFRSRRARRRSRALLVPLVAVIGVLGACGGDDGGDAGSGDAGSNDVSTSDSGGEASMTGEELFGEKGCAGCHETDVAPDLEGLYMQEVELEDGSTVVADEEYLERSIREPDADIVAGASVKMPNVSLSDEEVERLVAYIRDLGS